MDSEENSRDLVDTHRIKETELSSYQRERETGMWLGRPSSSITIIHTGGDSHFSYDDMHHAE